MSKISVIMPVYNSEKYLKDAIDSLTNQTLKDIEIILVDDGSTDNSPKICDDYTKKDKRVIVKHIKNGGISNARNVGLKEAKSKYIMFMDHDDIFDLNVCEDNYKLMKKYNYDVIKFSRKEVTLLDDRIINEDLRIFENKALNKRDLEKEKMDLFYNDAFECVWDGIYKKDILPEFNTSLKLGGEDVVFGLEMFPKINKLLFRKNIYYYHYIRQGISTSTKYNKNIIKDINTIYNTYKKILGNDFNVNINKYNLRIIDCYLTTAIMNLANPLCELTKKEKVGALKSLNIELKRKSNVFIMFKLSPIYTLIFIMYKLKLYSLLILMGESYKKAKIKHIEHRRFKERK